MEKEIYTPMERILIEGAKAITDYGTSAVPANELTEEKVKEVVEWFNTSKKTTSLLELDEMLLKMEQQANMMDGIKMEEWIL